MDNELMELNKNNSDTVTYYVASTRKSYRISEDEFETITITKICTKETTLGEIEDWFREHFRSDVKLYCDISTAT